MGKWDNPSRMISMKTGKLYLGEGMDVLNLSNYVDHRSLKIKV